MPFKLKALGLAPIAILALMALMVSTAQAQFTSDKEHTIISGSQEGNHVFTAGAGFGGVTCATMDFAGTSSSKSAGSQVLIPTGGSCKDSFGRTVDGDSAVFTYTFTPNGSVHVSGNLTATITSSGSVICTVVFTSPQTDNGITYHDLSGTNGIKLTTNITNIKATTSGGFFNCGISNGEHTEGTYTGTTTLTGESTEWSKAAISVD